MTRIALIQYYVRITSGYSIRLSSEAAASEEARHTLSRMLRPLNDAKTKLADFFNILLRTR